MLVALTRIPNPPSTDPIHPHARAVYVKGERVGQFGVVHPEVLQAFDITYPVSALELNLEPFCFDQVYRPLPCGPPT